MAYLDGDDELERSTTRWMGVGVGLTAVFALMFPIYRWYEPSGRAAARAAHEASLAALGSDIYESSCASCHGVQGQGVDAPALNSRQFLEAATDEQIASLIAHGIPGTAMSAYSLDFGGFLTSEQIKALTTYLRSLEADAPDRPDWRDPEAAGGHDEGDEGEDDREDEPATTEPTDHDDEPATIGHDDEPTTTEPTDHDDEPTTTEPTDHDDEPTTTSLEPAPFDAATAYASLCASCHGSGMGGDIGPALGPTSHSLSEPDEHLAEAIAFGRREMPAFSNELTSEQTDEIVAYIRQIQAGE